MKQQRKPYQTPQLQHLLEDGVSAELTGQRQRRQVHFVLDVRFGGTFDVPDYVFIHLLQIQGNCLSP
jgi:hypothetical protein